MSTTFSLLGQDYSSAISFTPTCDLHVCQYSPYKPVMSHDPLPHIEMIPLLMQDLIIICRSHAGKWVPGHQKLEVILNAI